MKRLLISLVATGFGVGYLPKAPGTWGALEAFFWYLILEGRLSVPEEWFLLFLFSMVGLWAAEKMAKEQGVKDPQEVVIDEIAGQWLALLGTKTIPWMVAAFLLFRVYDIWKPLPVRWAERFPGGWGIMADDLVAGLLANLTWQLGYCFLALL